MTPKQINIGLKVAIGALIAVTLAGLYFANQRLRAVVEETAQLKAKSSVSEKQLELYKLTKIKVDSLGYVDELASKVLPDDKEQSVVVAELSQFALRARLSVAQINFPETATTAASGKTPAKQVIPQGVTTTPITIKFKEGSEYQNLLEFLRQLENNRRKTQVTSVDLTPDSKDRTKLSEVTVELNLYTRKAVPAQEKKQ